MMISMDERERHLTDQFIIPLIIVMWDLFNVAFKFVAFIFSFVVNHSKFLILVFEPTSSTSKSKNM